MGTSGNARGAVMECLMYNPGYEPLSGSRHFPQVSVSVSHPQGKQDQRWGFEELTLIS